MLARARPLAVTVHEPIVTVFRQWTALIIPCPPDPFFSSYNIPRISHLRTHPRDYSAPDAEISARLRNSVIKVQARGQTTTR